MKKILLSGVLSALVFSIFAQVQIGQTTYDLQTNNANCRRMAIDPAGQVIATYTKSGQFASDPQDRGTGYNFSSDNGATWSTSTFGPGAFVRPDTARSGWPNPVFTNTKEVIISHFAGVGAASDQTGLQVLRRDIGTSGPWEKIILNTANATNPANSQYGNEATWARAAANGDSIFVISGLGAGATLPGMTVGGMQMYRSIDGGATWDGPNDIPLVNSTNFTAISGDNYALDMNANGTIAIVLGAFQIEVLTSTDWGATFTKQSVLEITDLNGLPTPLFSGQSGETMDTFNISDGAYTVIVDDNDMVHVWFGRIEALKPEATTTGYNYFPQSLGLAYWNDGMTEARVLHETRLAAQQVGLPNPLFNQTTFGQGGQEDHYSATFTSMASSSYDDNGNIYIAYSSLVPATFDDVTNTAVQPNNFSADGLHYRDIFIMKSADNGVTWEGPINVSNEPRMECVYPSVPRKIFGTDVPVMWQQDTIPGLNVQGVFHAVVQNEIMFVNVAEASIITPADITAPTMNLVDQNVNLVEAFEGCDVDFASIFNNDDVPTGPNVLDYQVVPGTPFTAVGQHIIDVFVLDAAGNSSDTMQAIVEILADVIAPVVTLIGPNTVDMINGTTYTDPGIDFSDNGCDPSATPTISTDLDENLDGTYTYTWIVEDNSGNIDSVSRTVNVIGADVTEPVITAIAGLTQTIEACGTFVDPGVTAFDNIDYDLTPMVTTTGMVNENLPGTYTLIDSVTDAAGNIGTLTRTIIVVDQTDPEITINNTAASLFICIGGTFVADADATDCVDPAVVLTNNANTQIDNTKAGLYVVTFTAVDNSGNDNTETVNVQVGAAPVPAFDITSSAGAQVVQVQDKSTGSPNSWIWNWNDPDNSNNSFSQIANRKYETPGNYTIDLTVSNNFVASCNASAADLTTSKTVSVTVGIAELNKLNAAVSVFPNPSNGIINVSIDDLGLTDVQISVYNVIGDLVSSETIANTANKANTSFDLGSDASGIYFVTISTEKATLSKKVMVK